MDRITPLLPIAPSIPAPHSSEKAQQNHTPSMPQSDPAIAPPITHTSPSATKVAELPEKQRARAYSTSTSIGDEIENGHTRATYLRIQAVAQDDRVRVTAAGLFSSPYFFEPQPEKRRLGVGTRRTLPQRYASPWTRSPHRVVHSAPAIPQSVLARPVPASPVGNAWSGEHYWAPQFSPMSPTSEQLENGDIDYSTTAVQPFICTAYDAMYADVEARAFKLETEAHARGEQIPSSEIDVIAAEKVLEEKNAELEVNGGFPLPNSISSRILELALEERRALDAFAVRSLKELEGIDAWLCIDESTLIFTTILDRAKEALHMLKKRRKKPDIELSASAYSLVFALQLFEEKLYNLSAEEFEDSSGDELDYGLLLKSIDQELKEEAAKKQGDRLELRRNVELKAVEERRLKGKAPSALDLANWALEMKKIAGAADDIGRAITKDN